MIDLATRSQKIELAKRWASTHSLDPRLVCALIEQESNWNTWAVRFEPSFLSHYVKPVEPLEPSTMEIMRATSFGLMQIMGQTAMELGWRGYFLTDLCDPDNGVDFGCRKLKRCVSERADVEQALLAYNGGGNSYYGKQVLERMQHYATEEFES